jgi:hypothetical protein
VHEQCSHIKAGDLPAAFCTSMHGKGESSSAGNAGPCAHTVHARMRCSSRRRDNTYQIRAVTKHTDRLPHMLQVLLYKTTDSVPYAFALLQEACTAVQRHGSAGAAGIFTHLQKLQVP